MSAQRSVVLNAFSGILLFALPAAVKEAEKYEIDSGHSSALFSVKHYNAANFYGRFNDIKGSLHVDEAKAENCSVEIVVQAESIDTNSAKRDQHLKSPDFFSVKEFPTLNFKSTKVKSGGKDQLDVTGDFTMHGVTKSISFPVTLVGKSSGGRSGSRIGYEAKFKIKRSDYGMSFMLDSLSDEVQIIISLEAVKK